VKLRWQIVKDCSIGQERIGRVLGNAGERGANVAAIQCACTTIRRASRAITQLYDLVLSPTGLRATQFVILSAIDREGERAQCRLAQEYAVSVETLSRRLAGLRRKRLVHLRDGSPHHQHVYTLTEMGRRELEKATPHWNRAQARLAVTLGEAGLKSLFDICERLVAGARQAQVLRVPNYPLSVEPNEVVRTKKHSPKNASSSNIRQSGRMK